MVTGDNGLVGSAIVRLLRVRGFWNLIHWDRYGVDLRDPVQCRWAFSSYIPEFVFHCAARVGGIVANRDNPVEFFLDNLRMEMNVFTCAHEYGVKKLLFFGSACAYPKLAKVPISESALLTGSLEPTNECYALAKIVGIKLGQSFSGRSPCKFISAMPTNLYGLNDNYHPVDSHVIPGMIRRIHEAKTAGSRTAKMWGSGRPRREFLYADDLAEAALLLMEKYDSPELINAGVGKAISLCSLAERISRVIGFTGLLEWDTNVPDGTPDRCLDVSKLFSLGWRPKMDLDQGLALAYEDSKTCKRGLSFSA